MIFYNFFFILLPSSASKPENPNTCSQHIFTIHIRDMYNTHIIYRLLEALNDIWWWRRILFLNLLSNMSVEKIKLYFLHAHKIHYIYNIRYHKRKWNSFWDLFESNRYIISYIYMWHWVKENRTISYIYGYIVLSIYKLNGYRHVLQSENV